MKKVRFTETQIVAMLKLSDQIATNAANVKMYHFYIELKLPAFKAGYLEIAIVYCFLFLMNVINRVVRPYNHNQTFYLDHFIIYVLGPICL